MEVTQFLSLALSSLVVIVILHFVVFWVVKTMYPPQAVAPLPVPVTIPAPAPVAFTEPPPVKQDVDVVNLPTYTTSVPAEAPREEEPRRGPPPPEETSIRRKAGMDAPIPGQ